MKIYKSINEIMKDLAKNPIKKEDINQHQKYKYRGIEAICNGLSPLFSKYQVIVFPEVLEMHTEMRGKMFNTVIKIKYTFVSSEDESKFEVIVSGEGADVGDKSINKAHTSAYKNCMNQTFCIPTESCEDPDYSSHAVFESATPDQIKMIFSLIKETNTDQSMISDYFKVDSLQNLDKSNAEKAIAILNKKMSHKNK